MSTVTLSNKISCILQEHDISYFSDMPLSLMTLADSHRIDQLHYGGLSLTDQVL